MSTIKKMSFLLFAFLLVGCFSEDPTGDASILQSNRFLTDENHIIESKTLSSFMELLEDKDKAKETGTMPDIDDDGEEIDRDIRESEKRTIVVFGNISTDYNSLTTSLLNGIVKNDDDFKEIYEQVFIVPISAEIYEYEKYVAEYLEINDDNDSSGEETEETTPSDVVNDYIDLLKRVGIKSSYKFELDEQWAFAQLYEDVSADESNENTPIKDTETGRIQNASYLTEGTVLVFGEENEVESSYLLNTNVGPAFYELYQTEDEDGNELDNYEFNKNGKCFVYGECTDNEIKEDWKGIEYFLQELF